MGSFQELKVWQRAKELALFLYRISSKGALSKDRALKDQMRRAVVSIPSAILRKVMNWVSLPINSLRLTP
ncbi:MAG: four helix bundle protein [Deltaproteobacteria bacterium]|nr:four helix bundle protein [Deltaproteobacteria bacterium]MBW2048454.1 four helix bundle protein [Deltaproteobacteria bacterium]MBW2111238.1 four helix bundle protein [Deltaproteobacteria bacterium]MBW2353107.1 four helix bundle protein [Deltaproteobacteria bacterium]